MKIRFLGAIAFACSAAYAASTPANALLVLSKTDTTLSIVDPATLKVLAKMPSGPDPHEVVASADGKFAYVSNYGGGAYNTITVIDLAAQKTLTAIDLGALRGPHGLWYAGGKLWFTAEAAKVIGSLRPGDAEGGPGARHGAEPDAHDLGLGRLETDRHFKREFGDDDIHRQAGGRRRARTGWSPSWRAWPGPAAAPGGDWNETVVAVGRGAEGFDVSPDGRELWAANAQDGTISVVDMAGRKVVETLSANVNGANRLKFTPDGKMVLVSTLGGPDLTVLDAATRKVVKRVKIGQRCGGNSDEARRIARVCGLHTGQLRRGGGSEVDGSDRAFRCREAARRHGLGGCALSLVTVGWAISPARIGCGLKHIFAANKP